MKPIVIFDDRCSVCTAFGSWGRNVVPLGYTTKPAKRLMKAQFGKDYGFILMLFVEDKVYWGDLAAAEITKTAYSKAMGTLFRRVIRTVYPWIVSLLNVLLRRKLLPHPPKFKGKRLPGAGSMPLTKKALEKVMAVNKPRKNALKQ